MLRAVLILVFALSAGALGAVTQRGVVASAPSRPAPHNLLDKPSLEACGACHADVYQEWAASLHHGAWTNQNVRTATKNFTLKECRACHSPMPMLATGLETRPAFRDFNHEDGVHCLSCHGLEQGVAAARSVPGAPCNPIADLRIGNVNSCFPCHEPTHQAYSEYYTSKAFRIGTRCMDCHMPELPGGRRSHGPHGGFSADFVKNAIAWECKESNGAITLTLINKTGHKFPGEIPSRVFVIKRETVGGRTPSTPEYEQFRKPGKMEDREDDRLLPDEARTLHYKIPEGAESFTITLLFKVFPIMPDDVSTVLGTWTWKKPGK